MEARKRFVRVAADGYTDPLRVIVPAMLEGEVRGTLPYVDSLRGVLRRLGCTVTLWWKPDPKSAAVP